MLTRLTMRSLAMLLAAALPAQVVRLANHHPYPHAGWIRATIDVPTPALCGVLRGTDGMTEAIYRRGRQIGEAKWAVDVSVRLEGGQQRQLDLSTFQSFVMPAPQMPTDVIGYFGGALPTANGTPLMPVSFAADGAGFLVHLGGRIGGTKALVADVWVLWYPQQAWCHGEAMVTCSNPMTSDLVEQIPNGVTLAFGDAQVLALGAPAGQIVAPGMLADGQARVVPFTLRWLRHLPPCDWSPVWGADEWATIFAFLSSEVDASYLARGIGIRHLLADGNPSYAPGFDPAAWTAGTFAESVRRLRTWDPNLIGPSIRSSDTGAQEDQVFVRGEALLPGGVGAELVAYLNAIKLHGERPSNHCEADGSPLEPQQHTSPRLLFWDGRVHPSAAVSPDRLGKARALAEDEAHYRYGPDIEHLLVNTLAATCRLVDSPAAQRLLRNLCVVYLLQRTTDPSWSTSTEGNWTRALGWEGIFVVHVWRDLEDRAMAQRVVDRWRTRCTNLILPRITAAPNDIWDVRTETSASVPIQPGWMPWQQAIAAYGLDLACRVVGPAEGCSVALRGARRVVADAWVREGDRWVEYERLSLAGDRSRSGYFAAAWLPTALPVVLRYEANEKAASVWAQILADVANGDRRWIPPTGGL